MYFTTQEKVRYCDCDCNNRMKVSAAMKYMQQCSSEQLCTLGFSPEKLYAEDLVFLLSKMCIKVHRLPECAETLVVGTAPVTPRGAQFIREFVIESEAGERLLSAFSMWLLVVPSTRKILRPRAFPYSIDFQQPTLDGIIDDIEIPKGSQTVPYCMKIPVRYSHIDVNHHVNNTFYADFVCDALPYSALAAQGIDHIAVRFQNEATIGQVLEVHVHQTGAASYYLSGLHEGSPCFEAVAALKDLS